MKKLSNAVMCSTAVLLLIAVFSSVAAAAPAAKKKACSAEVKKLCGKGQLRPGIPVGPATVNCLYEAQSELSQKCMSRLTGNSREIIRGCQREVDENCPEAAESFQLLAPCIGKLRGKQAISTRCDATINKVAGRRDLW